MDVGAYGHTPYHLNHPVRDVILVENDNCSDKACLVEFAIVGANQRVCSNKIYIKMIINQKSAERRCNEPAEIHDHLLTADFSQRNKNWLGVRLLCRGKPACLPK